MNVTVTQITGKAMKLLSPTLTVALSSLPDDLLPYPCCKRWNAGKLECHIHSRTRAQIETTGDPTNSYIHVAGCQHGKSLDYNCADSPDGQHHFQYVWLGWPGTWCIFCRTEDGFEECLSRVCSCMCHHLFWKHYWWEAMEFDRAD